MKKIIKFFKTLFTIRCPKCNGIVVYIGDDITKNNVWISIYQCKQCKTEFI